METAILKLTVYGPLGIISVVLMYACVVLYRSEKNCTKECAERIETLQENHREQIRELTTAHKTEMSELVTRHITKAETWVEKGNELATNLNHVLDSIARKRMG